jgi:hypothetical protein
MGRIRPPRQRKTDLEMTILHDERVNQQKLPAKIAFPAQAGIHLSTIARMMGGSPAFAGTAEWGFILNFFQDRK